MNIKEYRFIDPGTSEAGRQLEMLAYHHPFKAARLIANVEAFVLTDTDLAHRIVVNGQVEIYFVPPRYILVKEPDAAALIRVDQANRQVRVVRIVEEYGGPDERADWDKVVMMARQVAA
jgi:hypothetical protein